MRVVCWLLPFVAACAALSGLNDYDPAADDADGGGGHAPQTTGGSATNGGAGQGGMGEGGKNPGGAGGGSPTDSCDALYGDTTSGCQLCGASADSCILFCTTTVTMPTTPACAVLCANHGSECDRAEDNLNTDVCVSSNIAIDCVTSPVAEKLCFCSKTCGAGPKCSAGSACINGICM